MKADPRRLEELRRIADEAGGILKPEDVVDAARPKSSPLHSVFTWDDSEAASNYRLWQARQLIRTTIQYMRVNGDNRAVRVFVSLTPDREEESGGYRETNVVLSDAGLRKQMLADALAELRVFEQKYSALKELAEVFSAIRRVKVRRTA